MRSKGFEGMICSVAGVMGAIGDRWGLLIMRDLVIGLHRYDDFRQSSGVTNATLSDRLKHLEATGLVERRRYQTNPERFEYWLTPKGRQIAPMLALMAQLGDRLEMNGAPGPPMKFINRKTGAEVQWAFLDTSTGQRLTGPDIAIEAGPGADELTLWRLARARQIREAEESAKDSADAGPSVGSSGNGP